MKCPTSWTHASIWNGPASPDTHIGVCVRVCGVCVRVVFPDIGSLHTGVCASRDTHLCACVGAHGCAHTHGGVRVRSDVFLLACVSGGGVTVWVCRWASVSGVGVRVVCVGHGCRKWYMWSSFDLHR